LYNPDAIRRALEFDHRAKFIVSVRNPVEMMRSFHARLLFSLDEDVEDFAQAWELQDTRARGREIPKRCREPQLLQYGEVGRLGQHVERLFEVAGAERCMVVVFDDWVGDTRTQYARLLEFIGVDDDGQTEFRRTRETAGFKSRWLQQFVMNPPPWTYRLLALSDRAMVKRLKRIRKRIKSYNVAEAPRQTFSDEMRAVLRSFFADDVRKLGSLIDRDLTHWLE
jgi:hypothetical protein